MTQVTLIPNVRVKSEHGNLFPQALIHIRNVVLNDNWSMSGDVVGEDYKIEDGISGATYEVAYYGTQQAFTDKYPICPLREYDGESFSNVLVVDMGTPEIERILVQATTKEQKATAIVRADIDRRAR